MPSNDGSSEIVDSRRGRSGLAGRADKFELRKPRVEPLEHASRTLSLPLSLSYPTGSDEKKDRGLITTPVVPAHMQATLRGGTVVEAGRRTGLQRATPGRRADRPARSLDLCPTPKCVFHVYNN